MGSFKDSWRPALEFDPRLEVCPLCGDAGLRAHARDAAGVAVERCGGCGLLFMNPQYTDDALSSFYAGYRSDACPRGQYSEERRQRKLRNFERLRAHISGGRFLAVGCGDGLELLLARELGFEVEGLDVDPDRCTAVAETLGCPVHVGDLIDVDLQPGTWSCIYLDKVLEHPKNPGVYLRRIHELLAPGGVLYLGVPNIASISSLWKSFCDRTGLRNAKSVGSQYDAWQHLSYFRPRQLGAALEGHFGFEVLDVAGDPDGDSGGGLGRLRQAFPWLDSSMLIIARRRG